MVSPPHWLSTFANSVAAHIYSFDDLSPLGCHFQKVDHVWEVTVFASHTEIVGGSRDGRILQSSFTVDIQKILDEFSHVESVTWQSQTIDRQDELGAHLAIEGRHEDKNIWLRVIAKAPQKFGAGRRVIAHQRKTEDLW